LNKYALRKFATNARVELLERVELQARKYGVTKELINKDAVKDSRSFYSNGDPLSDIEIKQRDHLLRRIEEIGFGQVIEEVAYTWFNRFVALRFMEVNDYLPTRVRVLSSEFEDSPEPDMLREALSLDLDIDRDRVYEYIQNSQTEELFKYLIKQHCNDLNRYMPFMFETLEDYTTLLFPEGLLSPGSFVREMTNTENIPEENWEQVEIIGWLYQFYIAEEKDRVFSKKGQLNSQEISAATQLFTPDWIVQYMVQNSLGRYWVESHPEQADLTNNWDFFIEHQQEDFHERVKPYINKDLNLEEIKCLDPAMGSGHILIYMFDVLYEIYQKNGYVEREIPRLIIENNLYGIDIDERAYQLAGFSLTMKALEYNRRFLRDIEKNGIEMNLISVQETNHINADEISYLAGEKEGNIYDEIDMFLGQYKNAKTIGSILKARDKEKETILDRLYKINLTQEQNIFDLETHEKLEYIVPKILKQTDILTNKYDILVTNPPYINPNFNKKLYDYVRTNYPDSSRDLFAVFMELDHLMKDQGMLSLINQHSWMFLSSYEKFREKVISKKTIDTMLHLGPRAFEEIGGEVVQSTAFVLREQETKDITGEYIRLVDKKSSLKKKEGTLKAIKKPEVDYRYTFEQKDYTKIPGSPISYWTPKEMLRIFNNNPSLSELSETRLGMATANNDKFLRFWHEVDQNNIYYKAKSREESQLSKCRWFPYNKGGSYRKWYGNNYYVVDWEDDGYRIRNFGKESGRIRSHNYNLDYIFKPGITWSALSSGKFSSRLFESGFLFDNSGSSLFIKNKNLLYKIQGYLSTKIVQNIFPLINPTLNYQPGTVGLLPVIESNTKEKEIVTIVKDNVTLAKQDWDSFEISWDFKRHPFLKFPANTVEESFNQWEKFAEKQFYQLKENEEELNRIFIDIYGLQDELTPDVDEKDVTVRKADLERDVKSFISYAIGCMFGRYSLDEDGLVYAGGELDPERYQTFPVDENNILPIVDGVYFEDDIVNKFVEFLEVTYGKDNLEENLNFIAEALGKRDTESARERLRRYFITQSQFYEDHKRIYKRTPIYWMFTSGRERAFNCLIYMHRYDRTTLSRIRTDYLHDVQLRYETQKQDAQAIIEGNYSDREVRKARKEIESLDRKLEELKKYDEKLRKLADRQIEFDLDDGVRENYKLFDGLLARL